MLAYDYSPVSSSFGAIFFIFSESRQAMAKVNRINPVPPRMLRPRGTVNVHFTIPMLRRKKAVSGLIIRLHTAIPVNVERITVGIKDRAVCKIS